MHQNQNLKIHEIKQNLIELKGAKHEPRIIIQDVSNNLLTTDRSIRQKISKDLEDLNKLDNQQDVMGIYTPLCTTALESTAFQAPVEKSPG